MTAPALAGEVDAQGVMRALPSSYTAISRREVWWQRCFSLVVK